MSDTLRASASRRGGIAPFHDCSCRHSPTLSLTPLLRRAEPKLASPLVGAAGPPFIFAQVGRGRRGPSSDGGCLRSPSRRLSAVGPRRARRSCAASVVAFMPSSPFLGTRIATILACEGGRNSLPWGWPWHDPRPTVVAPGARALPLHQALPDECPPRGARPHLISTASLEKAKGSPTLPSTAPRPDPTDGSGVSGVGQGRDRPRRHDRVSPIRHTRNAVTC